MEIREIQGHAEYAECLRLQEMVWGEGFGEGIPQTVFAFLREISGIVLGAYDGESIHAGPGGLVGLAISFPGRVDGDWVQWSDMVGVHPRARGRGIGLGLKLAQKERCLRGGVRKMMWTYDPLESRNAWLNFGRLGVRSCRYEVDFYGKFLCDLARGLESDRLIVGWDLEKDVPAAGRVQEDLPRSCELGLARGGRGEPGVPRVGLDGPVVWVENPIDLQGMKERNMLKAQRWREATREAFRHYLWRGYEVVDYVRAEGRYFYRLERVGEGR